jgi:Nucleotidyl transferase AbiEii toxin, Type IV TA system
MGAPWGRPTCRPSNSRWPECSSRCPRAEASCLRGEAALVALHLTARPTEDLDFFTAPGKGDVRAARDEIETDARNRGWTTQLIQDSDTFCRMVVRSPEAAVLIDLAVNAPPDLPASASPAGPTLAPEELAGHKLLALFDRAAARDFADVYVLSRLFGKNALLARAAQIDAGFDPRVLADMIATLDRFADDEVPVPDGLSATELRAFYAAWRSELAP